MFVARPAPRRRRPLPLRVIGVLLALALLGGALALILSGRGGRARGGGAGGRVVESIFQDDDHLLYSPGPVVARTLDTLRGLGVDRVRLTILWRAIAPAPRSSVAPPGFAAGSARAADPSAYPAAAWAPYDRVVELALVRGIAVDFNITAPGPLWAMTAPAPVAKLADHFGPSPSAFGAFVTALGRRYSGSYRAGGRRLPRVDFWSVWNEPNQPGWLAPQWQGLGSASVPSAPDLYRGLLDAAWSALRATGHGPAHDTILIGELAPEGSTGSRPESPLSPLAFLRSLYCLDASYHPLRGPAAAAQGCPRAGARGGFADDHPALFQATGFAHHPYSFFLPPDVSLPNPDFAPLADLWRLERALDASLRAYSSERRLPIYLTEYGYETNPPNPYRGVSPKLQSRYLNQAQYLAWKDPRVRSMAQFLLFDSLPDRSFPPGSPGYWSTFQTGLLYADGRRKPAFNSYRLPIVVSGSAAGGVTVWGMLRLAPNRTRQRALVQWRPQGGVYRTLAGVNVTNPSGFFTARLRVPGAGAVRILWTGAGGASFHSRSVGVS